MVSGEPKVKIFNRMAGIPLIASTLILAEDIYGKLKNYNGFLNNAFNKAEHTMALVTVKTAKVTDKLQKPISIADTLACNGLDSLEKSVPAIKKSPKEMRGDAMQQLSRVKEYAISQLVSVKEYARLKCVQLADAPLIAMARRNLIVSLDTIDKTMDAYLPANERALQVEHNDIIHRLSALPLELTERLRLVSRQLFGKFTFF